MAERRNPLTDGSLLTDRSDLEQVLAACMARSVLTQRRCSELVVRNRNWNADLAKGTLSFGEDAYPMQFLGSEASGSSTWMWGWNNINGFDGALIRLAERVREWGAENGLSALTEAKLPLTELENGRHFAVIAAALSETPVCWYRGPHSRGAVLMAFSGLPDAVFAPADAPEAATVLADCISGSELDHRLLAKGLFLWNGTPFEETASGILAQFEAPLSLTFDPSGRITNMVIKG